MINESKELIKKWIAELENAKENNVVVIKELENNSVLYERKIVFLESLLDEERTN